MLKYLRTLTLSILILLSIGCTATDMAKLGMQAAGVAEEKGIEANATVQVAKDAESNKNKLAIKADTEHHIKADTVQYVQELPWYVYAMIIMAWLIKEPLGMFSRRK